MDPIFEIELEDCPICRGVGAMQDEQGWCVSVNCLDCGAETAHASYHTPEERLEAAKRVALLWNMGKVIHTGVGDSIKKKTWVCPAGQTQVFWCR